MGPRHFTSIDDFTDGEIETVFARAEKFLEELGDPNDSARIARSAHICEGAILATLFHEPSTRTRLSFESAMSRLGGGVISSADPATSSAAKGETLADTARIVSAYADIIVLRHPREGAAKRAAEYATVPVINGGDGAHEHPTQTLCDLFTIRREKGRIENLNVALFGDLKGSRTIHSLVHALARFGANLLLMAAPGMELPDEMRSRLLQEFGYISVEPPRTLSAEAEAYTPRDRADIALRLEVDVLYLTRFQKERWAGVTVDYPVANAAFLNAPHFEHAIVLHPLPRVNELDAGFDTDFRAAYFRQAAYGVPVRMALIAMLLSQPQSAPDDAARGSRGPAEGGPALCGNANCITRSEGTPRFVRSGGNAFGWRCAYCDSDFSP